MKATSKQLFDYASGMTNTSFYQNSDCQSIADDKFNAIVKALPETSLAYKIATSGASSFSEKQTWVIAFELQKNDAFAEMVGEFYAKVTATVNRQKQNKQWSKELKAKRQAELKEKLNNK